MVIDSDESLNEIRDSAETIKGGADKILNRVRLAQDGIARQVENLREQVAELKASADP